jgi:predicted MPP superfamily phosphohydrolase
MTALLFPFSIAPISDWPLALFLLAGACAGHATWLACSLNLLHGYAFPRPFLKAMKKSHTLVVFLGPPVFLALYGLGLPGSWSLPPTASWLWIPNVYTLFCWIVGFGVVPLLTVLRLLQRQPPAVVQTRSEIVDVARELGYPPVGRGKYRSVALWPGNQVFQVEFSEKDVRLPRLPAAWHGLKILHLTDLHMCGTPDKAFYRHVVDRCNDWRPDLVAVTGDIVDSEKHHRWILPVFGRLRWRIAGYAILGNHDSWHRPDHTRRRLRRIGFRVLDNRWEQIDVDGKPMTVIGHEGPWFLPEPALTDCPADVFRLLLSHTPDNIPWARKHGIDLVLAGHNHGGQIRFPLIGSVLVPSRYSRRYDCGVFEEPPTVMHVARGLAGQHPLRYNCRPEVTLLTLHATETAPLPHDEERAELLAASPR